MARWSYDGHTAREMSDLGLISRPAIEKIPDVFGLEDGGGGDDDGYADYDGVRIVTSEFVRHQVMHELTQKERRDAAKRLGFTVDSKTGFVLDANLDIVAGDFAAMMDDLQPY